MFWSTRPPGGCEDNLFSCFVFCYDNDNHVDHDLQDDDVQDGHDVAMATLHDDGDDYD